MVNRSPYPCVAKDDDLAKRYDREGLSVKNTFLKIADDDEILLDASWHSAPAQLNHLSLDDSLVGLSQSSSPGAKTQNPLADAGPIEACEPQITTMQIRNIPNRCTRDEVVRHIDELGFANQYDLFHMPLDKKRKSNLGFAFINFLEPDTAAMFQKSMKGTCVMGERVQQKCKKACTVAPASIQGVENYVRNLMDNGKQHDQLVVHEGILDGIEENMNETESEHHRCSTIISL